MGKFAKQLEQMIEEGISKEEYEKFYFETRNRHEKTYLSSLSLNTRQKLHKTILSVLKIKNRLEGFQCKVIKDERNDMEGRPIIFAPTHVGKFDIELISEAIKEHYYLLTDDYENIKGTLDSLFLDLNGVFYFLKSNQVDRQRVKSNMIEHLKRGGEYFIFHRRSMEFYTESNGTTSLLGNCRYCKRVECSDTSHWSMPI